MVTTLRSDTPPENMASASCSLSNGIYPKRGKLNFVTLNIKFDGDRDHPVPIPETGSIPPGKRARWSNPYAEHPWAERRSRIVDALLSTGDPDIIAFQEVYHNQLDDLQTLLGPTYAHVGVGRDDGVQAGEYSPIFYDHTRFEPVKWDTIWLSLTPDRPSKSWDANLPRIATFLTLRFRDNKEGGLIHVVNTHYDDQGVKARAESSILIRDYAYRWGQDQAFQEDRDAPFILMGDFNSPPHEDGYGIITSPHPLPTQVPSLTFLDAFTNLTLRSTHSSTKREAPRPHQSAPYGPLHTYTGFAAPGKERDTKRIDFIMLASAADPEGGDAVQIGRGGWRAVRYACMDNWVEEGDVDGWFGRWSDHRAVKVMLERE